MRLMWVFISLLAGSVQALPTPSHGATKRSFSLPLRRSRAPLRKRGAYSGDTGLGDFLDLFYTIPVTVGGIETPVNLDTGSSDFWVVSADCKSTICANITTATSYPAADVQSPIAGQTVAINLQYGDSLTGTHAAGVVAVDTSIMAGLSLEKQVFGSITDTNNTSVQSGASGIIGFGFPSESFVQAAVVNARFNNPATTDAFVNGTAADGPLLSRLSMSGYLEEPMFTVMLQRDVIDVSGTGEVTVGKLPDGVDNSSLTWVPVRLYRPVDGGLNPPTFAPNEVYPLRWEVPLEAVYLDNQRLDTGKSGVTALLDTGNSILRGPADIVNAVLSSVSLVFSANHAAAPTYPCDQPHTLTFQFGSKQFPIDPRDFISQNASGDATTCIANNIVITDPPSVGALFEWSLGDPFFKSNLVAFYYGNLTHPSVDPPRIGFMSLVPSNASEELQAVVSSAVAAGGNFESSSQAALTLTTSTASSPTISMIPSAISTTIVSSGSGTETSDPTTQSNRSSAPRQLHINAFLLFLVALGTLVVL